MDNLRVQGSRWNFGTSLGTWGAIYSHPWHNIPQITRKSFQKSIDIQHVPSTNGTFSSEFGSLSLPYFFERWIWYSPSCIIWCYVEFMLSLQRTVLLCLILEINLVWLNNILLFTWRLYWFMWWSDWLQNLKTQGKMPSNLCPAIYERISILSLVLLWQRWLYKWIIFSVIFEQGIVHCFGTKALFGSK